MRTDRNILVWLVALWIIFLGPVMEVNGQSAARLKNKASYLLKQGYVYEALPVLEKYCIRKPKDVDAALLLAEKLAEVRDYHKASDWYFFAYQSDSIEYREALFQYARLQKMVGAYENALSAFRMFEQIYKGRDTDKILKNQLQIEIEGCLLADSLHKNQQDVLIRLLDTSINKIYSEFSPVMIDDTTLIYGGMISEDIVYSNNNLPVKQFYQANKKNERWKYAGRWPFLEENPNEITGNGIFSVKKNIFYFTRCSKNLDKQVICQIFRTVKNPDGWSEPERLENSINLINYTSTHPAIGIDPENPKKEILYFVSNRPGGEGGYDLYYSIYNPRTDEYAEPKNLGKKLNTPADEYTVYVDPETRQLFFSSNGWPGVGGFDIFSTRGSKKNWIQPENIGIPFNSSADDLYFTTGATPQEGFFVSNRSGGVVFQDFSCCDDIYVYKWKKYINIAVQGSIAQTLGNSQLDILPNLLNPTVKLLVLDKLTGEYILTQEKPITTDTFQVNMEADEVYRILVEADNYTSKSFDISTRDYELSDTLNLRFSLEVKPEMPIIIEDILFEYGSMDLTVSSKLFIESKLIPVLKEKVHIRIEILAHTDNIGDEKFNLRLSQQRAESVREFLIQSGISKDRLKAIGFGELRPVMPNQFDDGSDNPEGRARNRRVELNILN